MSIVAGSHVPVIPSFETAGKVGAADPRQKGAIAGNVGCGPGMIVVVSTCGAAHCPAFGVNVYVWAAKGLIVDGDQVPKIPFGDVVANDGVAAPAQNGGIAAKFGTVGGNTVNDSVTGVDATHCPELGVNV